MKGIPIHSIELMKIRLSCEQLRDAAIDEMATVFKALKKSAETEALVLFMWMVL